MSEQTVFFTIASQNYIPQARCLFESLAAQHPNDRYLLCLVEEDKDPDLFTGSDVEVVLAKSFVGRSFYDLALNYSLVELSTAVKPFVIRSLTEGGAKRVIFIDPDCYLFSPLEEVIDLLDAGKNIIITPHATHPIKDEKSPNERDFLRLGTFNLGFIAVQDSEETRNFLSWWSDRLSDLCVFDPTRGIFVDQKWIDLAPSFFDGVVILRHPGYNVAYWNTFQREIQRLPGGWYVDGQPLRFFHFSDLPKDNVSQVSRKQDRLDGSTVGSFINEFYTYLARLASNALKAGQEKTYSYSLYWQGEPIDSQALRTALRREGLRRNTCLADFRDETPIARLLEPHPDLPKNEMFPVSRLIYDALLDAPLIARNFTLFTAERRARFFYWILTEGHSELQIDSRLLPWRELATPVPSALGGRISVPPIIWLLWLIDSTLRRLSSFEDEKSYSLLIIELQKQVFNGDRPTWLLPIEYMQQIVVGEEKHGITVAQYVVWASREDLQQAFDMDTMEGRTDFISWCKGPSPLLEIPWMSNVVMPHVQQRADA